MRVSGLRPATGRALIGLQCPGSAAASLEETWKYITERTAFGNPLAKYQGVTEPLAEAETFLEAARLLCYKTLWLREMVCRIPPRRRCANGGCPRPLSRRFTAAC
ncbi:MAG: hypothetical protein AMXMBFR74_09830 [Parvibaculum sp.]